MICPVTYMNRKLVSYKTVCTVLIISQITVLYCILTPNAFIIKGIHLLGLVTKINFRWFPYNYSLILFVCYRKRIINLFQGVFISVDKHFYENHKNWNTTNKNMYK
jgi:hypothetical protein